MFFFFFNVILASSFQLSKTEKQSQVQGSICKIAVIWHEDSSSYQQHPYKMSDAIVHACTGTTGEVEMVGGGVLLYSVVSKFQYQGAPGSLRDLVSEDEVQNNRERHSQACESMYTHMCEPTQTSMNMHINIHTHIYTYTPQTHIFKKLTGE